MKERPILFSAPMVRSLLAGRKTQTRRVVKPQPKAGTGTVDWNNAHEAFIAWKDSEAVVGSGWLRNGDPFHCPYGAPGDRLWLRETWLEDRIPELTPEQNGHIHYRADEIPVVTESWSGQWRPSIFMPRWASRITLEVTEVRVERLQSISEEDALAEGIVDCGNGAFDGGGPAMGPNARHAYMRIWDSLNGKKVPWSSNPWVWKIAFRRLA